jgi:hypothetical protein
MNIFALLALAGFFSGVTNGLYLFKRAPYPQRSEQELPDFTDVENEGISFFIPDPDEPPLSSATTQEWMLWDDNEGMKLFDELDYIDNQVVTGYAPSPDVLFSVQVKARDIPNSDVGTVPNSEFSTADDPFNGDAGLPIPGGNLNYDEEVIVASTSVSDAGLPILGGNLNYDEGITVASASISDGVSPPETNSFGSHSEFEASLDASLLGDFQSSRGAFAGSEPASSPNIGVVYNALNEAGGEFIGNSDGSGPGGVFSSESFDKTLDFSLTSDLAYFSDEGPDPGSSKLGKESDAIASSTDDLLLSDSNLPPSFDFLPELDLAADNVFDDVEAREQNAPTQNIATSPGTDNGNDPGKIDQQRIDQTFRHYLNPSPSDEVTPPPEEMQNPNDPCYLGYTGPYPACGWNIWRGPNILKPRPAFKEPFDYGFGKL